MIRTEPAKLSGPMTKAEAQAVTDRIRSHIDAAWKDLVRARDGKAWKALGYSTWEAYVKAEFGMSDRHSRRLLEQGEVIAAIEDATGPMGPLSERATRELKDDLPAVVEEIKARAEAGEDPAKAAKEIASAKRAEKAAQQATNETARDETRAKLSPAVQQQEQAKADAIAARKAAADDDRQALQDRIDELQEAVRFLEAENARLQARIKEDEELDLMRRDWREGGWDKVVQAKDDTIAELQRTAATRIERESHDKAAWKNSAKAGWEKAREAGYSRNAVIDLDTGEVMNG